MKKVLLVTSGIFHPTFFGRLALHRSLEQLEGFSCMHSSSLEKLPGDLPTFSALVLHYHHKTLSNKALQKLKEFVSRGGGILAIHAATASFKKNMPYFEILGGRFTGHGRLEKIEIRQTRDELFEGIGDFSLRDELYLHELQPGIEIHFTARHQGKDVPVVWTHRYGQGKICYAVPGHTTSSMKNRTYQQLLQRGLVWVTT
jgi:type 1 glutamine amidotransferase